MLKKRALTLLLSLAMLFTFMPAAAFADDTVTEGQDVTEEATATEVEEEGDESTGEPAVLTEEGQNNENVETTDEEPAAKGEETVSEPAQTAGISFELYNNRSLSANDGDHYVNEEFPVAGDKLVVRYKDDSETVYTYGTAEGSDELQFLDPSGKAISEYDLEFQYGEDWAHGFSANREDSIVVRYWDNEGDEFNTNIPVTVSQSDVIWDEETGFAYMPVNSDGRAFTKVVGYKGTDTVLTVPSKLGGLDVAFYAIDPNNNISDNDADYSKITKVILPEEMVYVKAACLKDLPNLEAVELTGDDNGFFKTADGVLYKHERKGLRVICFPPAYKSNKWVMDPDSYAYFCPAGEKLEEITISNKWKRFNVRKFVKAYPNVKAVSVADTNPTYVAQDGVLLDKYGDYIIMYPPAKDGDTYTVPDGVTWLERSSFAGNENLKTVILPQSVEGAALTAFFNNNINSSPALKKIVFTSKTAPNPDDFEGVAAAVIEHGVTVEYPEDGENYAEFVEGVSGRGLAEIPESVKRIELNTDYQFTTKSDDEVITLSFTSEADNGENYYEFAINRELPDEASQKYPDFVSEAFVPGEAKHIKVLADYESCYMYGNLEPSKEYYLQVKPGMACTVDIRVNCYSNDGSEYLSERFGEVPEKCSSISVDEEVSVRVAQDNQTFTFEFVPEKTGVYLFESIGDCDSIGRVLEEDKEVLGLDDDGGQDSSFKVQFTAEAGKTYYLQATTYSNVGSFVVTLKEEIAEHEHNGDTLEHFEAVEATKEKDGSIEYWKCTICGNLYKGSLNDLTRVSKADLVTKYGIDLSEDDELYIRYSDYLQCTGKQTIPEFKITYKGEDLTEGKDYTLTCPEDSVKKGSYLVTVNFIGDYTGSRECSYELACDKHTYGDAEVTKEPTCNDQGEKKYTCTKCGHESLEIIDKDKVNGHKWDEGKTTVEPTYDKEGVKVITCEVCGDTKEESVPKLTKTKELTDAEKANADAQTAINAVAAAKDKYNKATTAADAKKAADEYKVVAEAAKAKADAAKTAADKVSAGNTEAEKAAAKAVKDAAAKAVSDAEATVKAASEAQKTAEEKVAAEEKAAAEAQKKSDDAKAAAEAAQTAVEKARTAAEAAKGAAATAKAAAEAAGKTPGEAAVEAAKAAAEAAEKNSAAAEAMKDLADKAKAAADEAKASANNSEAAQAAAKLAEAAEKAVADAEKAVADAKTAADNAKKAAAEAETAAKNEAAAVSKANTAQATADKSAQAATDAKIAADAAKKTADEAKKAADDAKAAADKATPGTAEAVEAAKKAEEAAKKSTEAADAAKKAADAYQTAAEKAKTDAQAAADVANATHSASAKSKAAESVKTADAAVNDAKASAAAADTAAAAAKTASDNAKTAVTVAEKAKAQADEIKANTGTPEITLSATDYTYKFAVKKVKVGKKKKKQAVATTYVPAVASVKLNGKTLTAADYDVSYSDPESKALGTYTVTVTLKGKYKGTGTATYNINPKPAKISKPAKGKKKMTVKWKKAAKNDITYKALDGYEIQYSLSSDFSSDDTKTTTASKKAKSKAIKKLQSKQTYYVRIRTYKNAGGVRLYSNWSAVKSVKVK